MYIVYKWLHKTKEQGLNFFEKLGGMDMRRKKILKISWWEKQKINMVILFKGRNI